MYNAFCCLLLTHEVEALSGEEAIKTVAISGYIMGNMSLQQRKPL